jgi:hypothetical protein
MDDVYREAFAAWRATGHDHSPMAIIETDDNVITVGLGYPGTLYECLGMALSVYSLGQEVTGFCAVMDSTIYALDADPSDPSSVSEALIVYRVGSPAHVHRYGLDDSGGIVWRDDGEEMARLDDRIGLMFAKAEASRVANRPVAQLVPILERAGLVVE